MTEYVHYKDRELVLKWVEERLWRDFTGECEDIKRKVGERELVLVFVTENTQDLEVKQAAKYVLDAKVYICPPKPVSEVWPAATYVTLPSAVLIRRQGEEIIPFKGDFSARNIKEFLYLKEFPAVVPLSETYLARIFSYGANILLFLREPKDKSLDIDIARIETKGDVSVLYSDCSSDLGFQLCRLLKLTSETLPLVRLIEARGGSRNITQYVLREKPNRRSVNTLLDGWREGKLQALRYSQEVPSVQYDGEVKVLVGSTYHDYLSQHSNATIVMLLYAPWW